MIVMTDKDALQGKQLLYAERDIQGDFHFFSKAVVDESEWMRCDWDALASKHKEILAVRACPIGWSARRTIDGG